MIRLYEANQNKDRKSNIVIAQPGQEIGWKIIKNDNLMKMKEGNYIKNTKWSKSK
jgi:hypothetical protein